MQNKATTSSASKIVDFVERKMGAMDAPENNLNQVEAPIK